MQLIHRSESKFSGICGRWGESGENPTCSQDGGKIKSSGSHTTLKMKFFIKNFLNKCNQIHRKLWIWSHLLKKSSLEISFFVQCMLFQTTIWTLVILIEFLRVFYKKSSKFRNSFCLWISVEVIKFYLKLIFKSTTTNKVLWYCKVYVTLFLPPTLRTLPNNKVFVKKTIALSFLAPWLMFLPPSKK